MNPNQYRLWPIGSIDLAAGGTTPALELKFQHSWSISPVITGTSGSATYTMEVSHDNSEWKEYKDGSTTVNIDDAIQDDLIPWAYIRIVVTPGGGSSGSVDFNLMTKSPS